MVDHAPATLELDAARLARLRAAKASAEFFGKGLERLRRSGAPYVVLHRDVVVATGATADQAWESAATTRATLDECVLVFVPQEGDSYYF